jgi:hypothetical protein
MYTHGNLYGYVDSYAHTDINTYGHPDAYPTRLG